MGNRGKIKKKYREKKIKKENNGKTKKEMKIIGKRSKYKTTKNQKKKNCEMNSILSLRDQKVEKRGGKY